MGDVAADDDHARVEEVDRGGEHLAELAAGLAHELHRLRAALAHVADDVAGVLRRDALRAQPRGHRAAAGHGLQAAAVAAAADLEVAGHVDVADVARRALGAAVDPALGDDPAADAGADLDEEQVVVGAPGLVVLAQRHDVHVVVDERRRAEVVSEPTTDAIAVPAGHDRRRDRGARGELDRAGDADARAAHVVVRAAELGEHRVERLLEPGQDRVGAVGDRDLLRRLGQHLAAEVGHRHARVRRAQVRGEHHARVAVEGEHLRRAAARGDAPAGRDDQALRKQCIHALGDGGSRQAGQRDEFGTGAGLTVADQAQEGAGAR